MTGQVVIPFAEPPLGRITRGGRTPLHSLVPRVSHAAVRIPDPRYSDLPVRFPAGHPQLFVHEGARQALERRLATAHHRPVLLSVTDNTRHMVSHIQHGGCWRLGIHHMFLDAPGIVQEALVRYVVKGEPAASQIVSRYINEHGYRIRASRPVSSPLVTQGATHNLLALFHSINGTYFGGGVDALITWGRRVSRRSGLPRRAIKQKFGSYSAIERLIRVHPVLDKSWVPRYFVSYIVYHEMLHHVIPRNRLRGTAQTPSTGLQGARTPLPRLRPRSRVGTSAYLGGFWEADGPSRSGRDSATRSRGGGALA